jgi:hypothetical protein
MVGISAWEPTVEDVYEERRQQHRYYSAKSSTQYAGWNDFHYPTCGYGVWNKNPLAEYVNAEGKVVIGTDGFTLGNSCELKFFSEESMRYGSDNGGGAKHHPTRAQHMLRGDAIVQHLAFALLDALYMLRDDVESQTPDQLSLGECTAVTVFQS